MATASPAVPAEHPLLRLRPGTHLRVVGKLYTVRTAVQVHGGAQRWAEYLLDGPHADHWLAVEALPQGSVRLSRWTRTAAGPAGFDPERPEARGVRLVETERGEADFTATGDLSVLPGVTFAGRLRFVEYAGDGMHASLERLGPDAPTLLGIRTDVVPHVEVTLETPADRKEEPVPDTAADWLTDFFTDIYTDSDLELRDTQTTDAMVRCVSDALRLPAGATLLDLACGTGRHSVPLAAAGYTVTGVDLMESYLERARARAVGSTARFVRADMRDLSSLPQRGFDAVVSLHTSFGFFDTEEANLAVLEQIRGLLSPGGKLLIDVMNRDWFLSQSGESFGVEPHEFVVRNFDADGPVTYLYEECFSPLTSRIRWHIRTAGTTPERSATADYRIYSAHELCTLLFRAGFLVADVYGDYELSPFHVHAPHLIITAQPATGRT